LRRFPNSSPNFTIFAGGFGGPKQNRLPGAAKVIHGVGQVFSDAGAENSLVAHAFGRSNSAAKRGALHGGLQAQSATPRDKSVGHACANPPCSPFASWVAQAAFAVFSGCAVSIARM
jgi:hypothetical protein